jgi:hypothetical protein
MWVVIVVVAVVLVGAAAFAVSRRRAPDHRYEQDIPGDPSRVADPHHGEVGGRGSGPVGGGF